jgi:hypothetical protein
MPGHPPQPVKPTSLACTAVVAKVFSSGGSAKQASNFLMASRYWIKLYHEILEDPKMYRLSDRQFRRVIELFLLAGDCEMDGQLPNIEDINFRLRNPTSLEEDIDALLACEILTKNEDGSLLITRWLDRQTAMSDTERSQRRRIRERKQTYYRHESAPNRDTDKDIDTDKDTDKESNKKADAEADGKAKQEQTPENSLGGGSVGDELISTFIAHTNIPLNTGGQEKWSNALERLRKAGVQKGDLIKAIGECRNKSMIIANLSSIVNPAIIAMSNRKIRDPISNKEDYRRYLKGDFGLFGSH